MFLNQWFLKLQVGCTNDRNTNMNTNTNRNHFLNCFGEPVNPAIESQSRIHELNHESNPWMGSMNPINEANTTRPGTTFYTLRAAERAQRAKLPFPRMRCSWWVIHTPVQSHIRWRSERSERSSQVPDRDADDEHEYEYERYENKYEHE